MVLFVCINQLSRRDFYSGARSDSWTLRDSGRTNQKIIKLLGALY
jgi:hypothetical protein